MCNILKIYIYRYSSDKNIILRPITFSIQHCITKSNILYEIQHDIPRGLHIKLLKIKVYLF